MIQTYKWLNSFLFHDSKQSFPLDLFLGLGASELVLLSTHQTYQPVLLHVGCSLVSAAPNIPEVLSV